MKNAMNDTRSQAYRLAVKQADIETERYIARQGFTEWQLENEVAIQNEVDAFYRETLSEIRDVAAAMAAAREVL